MAEGLAGIVSEIRACVVSSKGPISVQSLSDDYKFLVGSDIPYRQFCYNSLEEFLRSLPSLTVCGSGSQATVKAAASSESSHISDLISKQKFKSKKYVPQPPRKFNPQPTVTDNGRRCGDVARVRHSMGSSQKYHSTRSYDEDFTNENYLRSQPSRRDQHLDSNSRTRATQDYQVEDEPLRNYHSWDRASRDYQPKVQLSRNCQEREQQVRGYGTTKRSTQDYGSGHTSFRNRAIQDYQVGDQPQRNHQSSDRASRDYEPKVKLSRNYQEREQEVRGYQTIKRSTQDYGSGHTSSWGVNHKIARKRCSLNFPSRQNTTRGTKHFTEEVETDRKVSWNPRDQGILVTIDNF